MDDLEMLLEAEVVPLRLLLECLDISDQLFKEILKGVSLNMGVMTVGEVAEFSKCFVPTGDNKDEQIVIIGQKETLAIVGEVIKMRGRG